jgi:anionic cell wall polymer biosynthesis LytR-Cps2A-Psr (LCP) family protein
MSKKRIRKLINASLGGARVSRPRKTTEPAATPDEEFKSAEVTDEAVELVNAAVELAEPVMPMVGAPKPTEALGEASEPAEPAGTSLSSDTPLSFDSSYPADHQKTDDPFDASSGRGGHSSSESASSASPHRGNFVRKRRKHSKRKYKALRIAAIIVAVLIALAGVIALVAFTMIRSGEAALKEGMKEAEVESGRGAVTYDEGKTVTYRGHTYALNEDMVSVVLIGFDRATFAEKGEAAGQADAIMVVALDTKTGVATVIAVPRDSMVEVDAFVGDAFVGQSTMQLCLSYSYGDGGEQSCKNTLTAVSRILYNMPIAYYFALDENSVAPLNDAVGGVALTPLQTIPNTNIFEGTDTVLIGNNAYRYVQWRDTSVLNSSLDRQARQAQYIKAFAAKALRLSRDGGGAGMLLDLFNTVSDYSLSNLGISEFSYLASTMLTNNITDVNMVTLDGEMVQGEVYAEYYLDRDAVYKTVLEIYYRQID